MSQSDKWLLIYGRDRQNKWLLQKQHFYCSPAISKYSKFSKKGFYRRIRIPSNTLTGLAVLSFLKKALSTFREMSQKFQCDVRSLSLKIYFILTLLQNNRSAVLKQPLTLPFLCHKSEKLCQNATFSSP